MHLKVTITIIIIITIIIGIIIIKLWGAGADVAIIRQHIQLKPQQFGARQGFSELF